MTRIENCFVDCWSCGTSYATHRVVNVTSGARPPIPPRCPECGASPRFASTLHQEDIESLFASLVRGVPPKILASEIEFHACDREQINECISKLGEIRNERLQKIRTGFNGQVPPTIRPGTKIFYDDELFAEALKEVEQLSLERMIERRKDYLINWD